MGPREERGRVLFWVGCGSLQRAFQSRAAPTPQITLRLEQERSEYGSVWERGSEREKDQDRESQRGERGGGAGRREGKRERGRGGNGEVRKGDRERAWWVGMCCDLRA